MADKPTVADADETPGITERSQVVRHTKNPFIQDMVVPVKGQRVQLSRIGKDDNVLINNATGEVNGTHVTTFRQVDSEQFVKLFTQNIALTFDLKAAGIKVFNVMMWTLQNKALGGDVIPLDKYVLAEFLESQSKRKPPVSLSSATYARGLAELEHAQIIAKHIRPGFFYINPNFCFNGDRIAFTTLIQRVDKASAEENPVDPPAAQHLGV